MNTSLLLAAVVYFILLLYPGWRGLVILLYHSITEGPTNYANSP